MLTLEERQKILKEFPGQSEILDADTPEARPNIALLRNNNNFRHDISRYQEDLREGRHDPEWITQAQAAHRKRELGVYDEFLANKFEEDRGLPMHEVEDIATQKLTDGGSRSIKGTSNDVISIKEAEKMKAPPEVPAQVGTALDDSVTLAEEASGDPAPFTFTRNNKDGKTSAEPADGDTIVVAQYLVGEEKDLVAEADG